VYITTENIQRISPRIMKLHAWIIGVIIGGAVGGYLSWRWNNSLYAGLGVGAGILAAEVIGWLYCNWVWRHRKRKGNRV
jgi:MFS family permease